MHALSRGLVRAVMLGGSVTSLMAACAAQPESVQAQYVSPLMYQSYNCDQVRLEMQRVSMRVSEVADRQRGAANRDSVAVGVGMILFWPALFMLSGRDHSQELGRLRGEYEAIEKAAIEKNCNVSDILEANRARAEAERQVAEAAQARAASQPTSPE